MHCLIFPTLSKHFGDSQIVAEKMMCPSPCTGEAAAEALGWRLELDRSQPTLDLLKCPFLGKSLAAPRERILTFEDFYKIQYS